MAQCLGLGSKNKGPVRTGPFWPSPVGPWANMGLLFNDL